LALELRQERFDIRSRRIKRALDLIVGVPATLVAMPIMAVAALSVMIMDGGSPFYAQDREGLGGRRIKVWKIRSMVRDAETRLEALLASDEGARREWAGSMKLRKDPRVIPVIGRILRKFSIDELPQLFGVVRGELSLVGPRPFPDYHLAMFSPEFRNLRNQVPPGITGYWQIMNRSHGDLSVQEDADSFYVQNWSVWLDVWILFQTVGVVVSGRGAY
jgi:lipopolysaccharide/colanic/teichoic acid biosynthesis glycosyltransferase